MSAPKPVVVVELLKPATYVRGTVSEERIDRMVQAIQDRTEPGKPVDWFLPPILVRPKEVKGKNGKATTAYEVVDGMKRTNAALRLKVHVIPAEVEDMADDEALARQVTTNMDHGDPLTIAQRDRFIKLLADPEGPQWSLSRIAQKFHLSKASVSRILKGTQTGRAKGAGKGRAAPKGGKSGRARTEDGTAAPQPATTPSGSASAWINQACELYDELDTPERIDLLRQAPLCQEVIRRLRLIIGALEGDYASLFEPSPATS